MTFRITAFAQTTTTPVGGGEFSGPAKAAIKSRRGVYFKERGGFVDCPVYDRVQLASKTRIDGPAILDQMDTTTLVLPDQRAELDEGGCLILTFK